MATKITFVKISPGSPHTEWTHLHLDSNYQSLSHVSDANFELIFHTVSDANSDQAHKLPIILTYINLTDLMIYIMNNTYLRVLWMRVHKQMLSSAQ